MTQLKVTNPNTIPHFKSNLSNFISTMDFKEMDRKTIAKGGRREYHYPIGDTEGFLKLFKNISELKQKTYMLEKDVVVRLSSKKTPSKLILGVAIYNGTTHPTILYIHEAVLENQNIRGQLHMSFDSECCERDLEMLKSEIVKLLEN